MKVGDVQYDPVNEEGNSVFQIPVTVFDEPMEVVADTTAMSVPHEIEYTLTFNSASLKSEKSCNPTENHHAGGDRCSSCDDCSG